MLIDPELTSVRLVTNPEKMVIKEAQRTWSYFNLFGYPSDLIVLNRLIPDTVADSYFADWKQTQSRHRAMVEERFAPVPIKELPLFRDEVVGFERLDEMGEVLFGSDDPAQVFFRGRTQQIERTPDGYILSLPLPFVEKGDVNLLHARRRADGPGRAAPAEHHPAAHAGRPDHARRQLRGRHPQDPLRPRANRHEAQPEQRTHRSQPGGYVIPSAPVCHPEAANPPVIQSASRPTLSNAKGSHPPPVPHPRRHLQRSEPLTPLHVIPST